MPPSVKSVALRHYLAGLLGAECLQNQVLSVGTRLASLAGMVTNEAREFSRRRSLPYVEARTMPSKRSCTVALSLCGKELGSKTDTIKRGKVVATDYYLPAIKE